YKAGAGLVECAIPERVSTVIMTNVHECITYQYSDESWVKDRMKGSSRVLAGLGIIQQGYAKSF
ncbi:MAG: hypothetical protein J6M39_03810, partial [Lachnospiraceae bacterium]|nr:hypothetical protein [Lachnospiraceae bacterium]